MISDRNPSPWLEPFKLDQPFFDPNLKFDVAIIGAGITGLTAAHHLAHHGLKVVVFDRHSVGHGETVYSTAHLTARPDVALTELLERFDEATVRHVWESGMEAIKHIEEVCVLEGIDAQFARVDGWLISRDEAGKKIIDDESNALKRISVAHEIMRSPLNAERALRIPDQARFDIGRYTHGLAQAAIKHGAVIVEQSAVVAMTGQHDVYQLELNDPAHSETPSRFVQARAVIIATHVPIWTNPVLLDKLKPSQSYVIAAKVASGSAPDALMDDTSQPYHYYRLEPRDGYDLVIFGGEDHPTGSQSASLERFEALERELSRWLPDLELEIAFRWSGEVWATLDGLPYIGVDLFPAPERFIATGFDGVGTTFGTLAGLMAAAWALGKPHQYADLYAPNRIALKDLGALIGQGLGFAKQVVTDKVKSIFVKSEASSLEHLQPDQATIVNLPDVGQVAAYKADDGTRTTISAACTHAGCTVAWNPAEKTWDCTCHGSRFAISGEVIAGPAVLPLKPVVIPKI